MAIEHQTDETNALGRRDIWKADQTRMLAGPGVHEMTEVRVYGYQSPIFGCGEGEQCLVTRVLAQETRFEHVMTSRSECFRQAPASAAVDQKPHAPATFTSSRESLATTARAYSRQARMSSSSRSG